MVQTLSEPGIEVGDLDALLAELLDPDTAAAASARLAADDGAAARRVLALVVASDARSAAHLAGARCLGAALLACPEPQHAALAAALARAGALTRWVYADLQRADAAAAGAALDFLALVCSGAAPLPADVAAQLGRALVRLLVDIAVDTEALAVPGDDSAFPPLCRSAVLALCAVFHQIALTEPSPLSFDDEVSEAGKTEGAGDVGGAGSAGGTEEAVEVMGANEAGDAGETEETEETQQLLFERLRMHRALSAVVLHPRTADGTLGQVLARFALRSLGDLCARMFCVYCRALADVCACAAVAYSVFYPQDLAVLVALLARALEDLDHGSPDPRRCAVLAVLARVFRDRVARADMDAEAARLRDTLAWLAAEYADPDVVSAARELLPILG